MTTAADVVNPNDGAISLREAIQYAIADTGTGALLDGDGNYKVTFADSVFTDGLATVKYFPSLGTITIPSGTFSSSILVVEAPGDNAKRVCLDGGASATGGFGTPVNSGNQGFVVEAGNLVTFRNLNFERFYVAGKGAAVRSSDAQVEFKNCAFNCNKASQQGGAVWAELGHLTFRDCSFRDNKATEGGALYFDGARVRMINVVVAGNNGYYACGSFENSYSSGSALYLANAATMRLGNAAFFGNYGGDIGLDATPCELYGVNSFFVGAPVATYKYNLVLSGSSGTVKLANCLVGTMNAAFSSLLDATGCATDVNKYYVYDGAETRTSRGVDHYAYTPKDYCLGTGVAVSTHSSDPFAGFGFVRALDNVFGEEKLVGASVNSVTGFDILGAQFLPSPYTKDDLRNCTIGPVHADAAVKYELSTAYDPDIDATPTAGKGAFVKKLSAGSVLPAYFDVPPVCGGRVVEGLCEFLCDGHTELESFSTGDSLLHMIAIFNGCTNLTRVEIGKNVTTLNGTVFWGAPNLAAIDVDSGNAFFKSVDGIVYSKSGTDLVCVPIAATVPAGFLDGVVYVKCSAMDGCTGLGETLVFPDSVIDFEDGAVCDIVGLKSIEFGSGIVSFGMVGYAPVLLNLPDLESVTFRNPGVKVHATEFVDPPAGFPALTKVEVVPLDPSTERFGGWKKVADPSQTWSGLDAFGDWNDYMVEPLYLPVVALTFDANGGSPVPADVSGVAGDAIAIPSDPAKEGFFFAGWFSDAALTVAADWTMPAGGGTYYAKWATAPSAYTLTFDTDGGSAVAPVTKTAGEALDALAIPTKTGFAFGGWYTDVACTLPFVFSTMPAMDLTVHAKWIDASLVNYTLAFEMNGGSAIAPITGPAGMVLGALPEPVRTGYTFVGWVDGVGNPAAPTVMPAEDTTLYATWTAIDYPVSYALGGGVNAASNPSTYTVEDAFTLAAPTRDRHVFTGWSPFGSVAAGTTGPLAFTANWVKAAPDLYETPADTLFMGNATYTGWIRNEDGSLKGLVTVKAAKGSKPERGGTSKLAVTYTPVGGRKVTVKPAPVVTTNQVAEVEIPDVGTFLLGGLSAAAGTADIQLARDLLKDKDRTVKAAAAARVAGMDGTWTFALRTSLGDAGFSLTVKKGKGKLVGVLPNGDKVSLSVQGILGESALAIPFVYSKKSSFALVFWIGDDRSVTVSDLTSVTMGGVAYAPDLVAPAALSAVPIAPGTYTFRADGYAQPFTATAKKLDAGKKDVNPAGLTLKLAPKTGLVTGAFKGAAGKMTVVGAVVDGVFYGTAYSRTVPGVAATFD